MTIIKNENISQKTKEARTLVNQARYELEENAITNIVCPKCNETPTLTVSGNRSIVRCKCGYLRNGEIIF